LLSLSLSGRSGKGKTHEEDDVQNNRRSGHPGADRNAILRPGPQRAPREVVVGRLAEKYGESRQSIGIGGQGVVMETFASTESGTWTITVTMPNGMTCLMASGQSYEALAEALPNADNDA
jgi:hypothetical protein